MKKDQLTKSKGKKKPTGKVKMVSKRTADRYKQNWIDAVNTYSDRCLKMSNQINNLKYTIDTYRDIYETAKRYMNEEAERALELWKQNMELWHELNDISKGDLMPVKRPDLILPNASEKDMIIARLQKELELAKREFKFDLGKICFN